jgi:membrane-associated protein
MEWLPEWMAFLHDPEKLKELIAWGGYAVLVAIVFAETGLLIGFFLPGDSLLVTAGLMAGQGYLNIGWLMGLLVVAAIVGDAVGYAIGYKAGALLFKREQSLFFRRDHLLKTQAFYERHGGKTIVIARFVPIIRTFAPVVAGIAKMEYRRFLSYNVFGGLGWVISMCTAGYFMGRIEGVDEYLHLIIAVVIFLSILPGIVEFSRVYLRKRQLQKQPENAVCSKSTR